MRDDYLLSAHTCDYHLLIILAGDLEVSQEVVEHLCHFLRLVLMDHVAHLV